MVENGIHPGDRDRVNTLVNESMTVTDSYEVSYRMLRRDGSYIWVLDRGLRNISEDGRPVIVSIVVDITRSHELQEQLQQSVVSLKEKERRTGSLSRRGVQRFCETRRRCRVHHP